MMWCIPLVLPAWWLLQHRAGPAVQEVVQQQQRVVTQLLTQLQNAKHVKLAAADFWCFMSVCAFV